MVELADELKIDSHKLNYHPERVASWLKGINIYPIYIEIGTTSICNHRCIFCALDFTGHKPATLETSILLNALSDMGKNGVKSVMFGGEGEPALHKDFAKIVEHAKKSGLDIAVTTNGIPFTKNMAELCLPHLSWIKFSIDAGTPATYAKIHGATAESFNRLMENIKTAVDIKNKKSYKVRIGAQILLIEENTNDLITLAKKVKAIGVDYLIVKPYSQHPDSVNKFSVDYARLKDLQKELLDLETKDFKIIFRLETMEKLKKAVPYKECYGLPFFALIDAKGDIIPCNLYYGKEPYYYGNLYENTFSEIWASKKRKQVIERIYKESTAKCRENCRLDSINRYLHLLKNPPEHMNFI